MPSWITALLAALPQLVTEAPALIGGVTAFIDELIAIFQKPTPPAGLAQATAPTQIVSKLQELRKTCVDAAAKKP